MAQKGTVWRCEVCGQKIKVLKEGGGILVCCGQEMVEVES
ncbi:MAG TPA: desulfoferrodoxin FeS4 iron-binding domain-containing protein [Candidatus Brocadiia bacterium]|nr:desulfoferrodoxin FeS4 iron-binding domain-containing protein [Candidatus Brocadiia bacterium]